MSPRKRTNTVVFLVLISASLLLAAGAAAETWFIQERYCMDPYDQGWGQAMALGGPPMWYFWEEMNDLPLDAVMPGYDLDASTPFYAATPVLEKDFLGYRVFAELWMANNFPGSANSVTVVLWKGMWAMPMIPLGAATVTVTNVRPAQPYIFDFGPLPEPVFPGERLIIEILYHPESMPFDCHIFWDEESTPSALHARQWTVVEGLHVPQNDPGYCEVLPGEDMDPTHTITWSSTKVRFFPSWNWGTPQPGDILCWLYDSPTQPIWWQGVFNHAGDTLVIQLINCDDNDGWVDVYVDGRLEFSYNSYHATYTNVQLVGMGFGHFPHTVKLQTRISGGHVAIDYVASMNLELPPCCEDPPPPPCCP